MRILNNLAVSRLLSAINLASPFGPRDHALIRLALSSGLRVSELTGLNVGHVFSHTPREWLDLPASIAKGHRSRQVPLSPPPPSPPPPPPPRVSWPSCWLGRLYFLVSPALRLARVLASITDLGVNLWLCGLCVLTLALVPRALGWSPLVMSISLGAF